MQAQDAESMAKNEVASLTATLSVSTFARVIFEWCDVRTLMLIFSTGDGNNPSFSEPIPNQYPTKFQFKPRVLGNS